MQGANNLNYFKNQKRRLKAWNEDAFAYQIKCEMKLLLNWYYFKTYLKNINHLLLSTTNKYIKVRDVTLFIITIYFKLK